MSRKDALLLCFQACLPKGSTTMETRLSLVAENFVNGLPPHSTRVATPMETLLIKAWAPCGLVHAMKTAAT